MKTILNIAAVAVVFVVAPSPCFAVWDVEVVTKERAKELGMEVRTTASGPKHVRVEFKFKPEGELKDFSHIDLRLGDGDDLVVAAALREDRSQPGRVAVGFAADSAQLDKFTLRLLVPYRDGGLGGAIYELRVKEFAE